MNKNFYMNHPDTISHIQKPNYEHIAMTQPHRLYADETGCRLELHTHNVKRLMWEVSGRSGVILGMTHSWTWGSQTQTFFLDSQWSVYSIGQYRWLTQVNLDIMLFYMLLNPIEQLDGWILQDIDQAKREQAPKTSSMIWLKSSWGKTRTFHPDLEQAIEESTSILNRIP
jgi:hypothetical protein